MGVGPKASRAPIGANLRVFRTCQGLRYEMAAFFRIFSSHPREKLL